MGAHSGDPLEAYIRLEDGETSPLKSASAERHDAAMAGIERKMEWLNLQLNVLAIVFSLIGGLLLWAWYYDQLPPEHQHQVYRTALLVSIPVVALFFTWFHIWLAIKMMFLPIRFFGIWQYANTGIGIGWQGVIPRKAEKMGRIAFSCARPYLMGPSDWFARVDTSLLFAKIHPMLERVARASMASVIRRHFPSMLAKDGRLPPSVENELLSIVMDKIEESFPDMWHKVTTKLCDPVIGLDNDGMIVAVFSEHKELLNHFFLSMGDREFRFIERSGAVLGFVCGLIQLLAFNYLDATGRMILLPGTGFFLGIFTNWLAIQMCFKPCHPRPVRVCGWYLGSIQGLFLKRQRDVATLYAKLLVDHFFDFHKVIAYLQTIPVWADLQDIYNQNIQNMMKQTMGKAGSWIAPVAVGSHKLQAVQDDLVGASAQRIAENDELQQAASQYLAVATDVFRSNAVAMQKMPPDEFERLLHPVFQEDEWILILLGGVLGAIVGIAQVYFLSE